MQVRNSCCLSTSGLGMGESCNRRVNAYVIQSWWDLIAGSCILSANSCIEMIHDEYDRTLFQCSQAACKLDGSAGVPSPTQNTPVPRRLSDCQSVSTRLDDTHIMSRSKCVSSVGCPSMYLTTCLQARRLSWVFTNVIYET